ncbi:ESCRT-III subunit protein VPS24 KNAG_0A07130 [Huiozyma naganishii CBS 8797]|uniref:Vacuolar protein-sorting-associated protein 24 n=1 Tax=Huiozyma naganishii (strain ATCC MYA-139 / BCRC 22969 / CBS 8797 / KCTC 17520 / NBRC 10181 / NCYC 3082 / Yp74L-3) TaxID=1071383 RepID=J7S436_HUIN7|nr:hypothetical protein KNAG_0A07130 [Kazachstania naganishii CBS 8797]CCK68366.1 hypothetical protein KNAG_0A07130 [Kazachstania naganishii CBS 8797]
MDYMKRAIWGPDPKEQHRRIKGVLRKNGRAIDRNLRDLSALQGKTKQLIQRAAKKQDYKSVQVYAKELYQINKQYGRMYTSKAQLDSVGMKIEEAYKMRTITNQMAQSASLMHEVNSLVHLPQLQSTMVELEKELMKAGIISEMVDDTMESVGEDTELDEEVDAEVNKIVEQYTSEQFSKVGTVPEDRLAAEQPVASPPQQQQQQEQPIPEGQIEEEADKMLQDMRDRLKSLQN